MKTKDFYTSLFKEMSKALGSQKVTRTIFYFDIEPKAVIPYNLVDTHPRSIEHFGISMVPW